MVEILKNVTKDSIFNVKSSLEFKEKINRTHIYEDEVMVSFDVTALFPSVPVEKALEIVEDKWQTIEKYTRIDKQLFMEGLRFCIIENRYFKYDDQIFKQLKGTPMGSPASPVIADIFMENLLEEAINKLTVKPRVLVKYVDDLFAIVKKTELNNTLQALNNINEHIRFTMEMENNEQLPFLDTMVIRHNEEIRTNWYKKPIASGRMLNFFSQHPHIMKINTIKNFIARVQDVSDTIFHNENKKRILEILVKNDYPRKMARKLINEYKKKDRIEENIEKPQYVYKTFTNSAGLSDTVKRSNIFDKNKIKLAIKSNRNVGHLFSNTKSKINDEEKSDLVYGIKCKGDGNNNCDMIYVGTTKTKLKTRISAHKSDQKNKNETQYKTALAEHCLKQHHCADFDNVKILQQEQHYSRRLMLEMLHIIDVPSERRINYKADVDNCANAYRHLIRN